MPSVVWARRASANPMGQERYEDQVMGAVRELAGDDWSFREVAVRSLRSPLPGTHRLPARGLARLPSPARWAVGRHLYKGADHRGPDLVHRFDVRLPPAGREVVTVHDAAPLRFADEGGVDERVVTSASGAVGALCPSRFAAAEAREVFGLRRTWVAHGGVDDRFFEAAPPPREGMAALGITRPYLLHAGGVTRRKNLGALAEAWRRLGLGGSLQLVLVGPPDERRTALFGDLPGTVLPGRVADELVPRLMAGAEVVVVPSIYEGFGLPALEAMATGTPVVAARRASLPEVVGDAGILVEPGPDELAEGIERVLGDDAERRRLADAGRARARSFTWAHSATAHLEAYREAIGC